MPHGAEAERLGHGDRAVPEARLGREELHADKALAELAQGQRRLQRRDAAARDHHREAVVRHVPIVREHRLEGIGESACSLSDFYGSPAAPTRRGRRSTRAVRRPGTTTSRSVASRDPRELRAVWGRPRICHTPRPFCRSVHNPASKVPAKCGERRSAIHSVPQAAGAPGDSLRRLRRARPRSRPAARPGRRGARARAASSRRSRRRRSRSRRREARPRRRSRRQGSGA